MGFIQPKLDLPSFTGHGLVLLGIHLYLTNLTVLGRFDVAFLPSFICAGAVSFVGPRMHAGHRRPVHHAGFQ